MTGPDWRTDLDAWRLDRAWDDLPCGRPMPPEMPLTKGISKFCADGSTIEPAAGFVARLEEEIMGVQHAPADKVVAPVAVLPTLAPLPVLAAPPRTRKSWPVVDVAMMLLIAGAIAAFVALQSGAFTLSSRDGDDGQPHPQISGGPATNGLPAIATTPAANAGPGGLHHPTPHHRRGDLHRRHCWSATMGRALFPLVPIVSDHGRSSNRRARTAPRCRRDSVHLGPVRRLRSI